MARANANIAAKAFTQAERLMISDLNYNCLQFQSCCLLANVKNDGGKMA
jgi:hypothetical protein